jgi:hypothetical protein
LREPNFMILGAMDQKLWMFEVLRRILGKQACVGANKVELTKVSKSGGRRRKKKGGRRKNGEVGGKMRRHEE